MTQGKVELALIVNWIIVFCFRFSTAGLWNSVSAPHICCGKNKSRSTKLFRSVSHLLVNIYCSGGG